VTFAIVEIIMMTILLGRPRFVAHA
jgi:hypothetical protein